VAAVIERAHQAAVKDALAFIEKHALFTRTGPQGIRQVNVRGLVAAGFTHRDSRAGDPDLGFDSPRRLYVWPSQLGLSQLDHLLAWYSEVFGFVEHVRIGEGIDRSLDSRANRLPSSSSPRCGRCGASPAKAVRIR
jgi:hypothetical protein